MSEALTWIEHLRSASTKDEAENAIWGLRDLAYDKPDAWSGLTPELLFQALAEAVEHAEVGAADWDGFAALVAGALSQAVKWSRPPQSA